MSIVQDIDQAKALREAGYGIAGFYEDIRMNMQIAIPPMFHRREEPTVFGRVIHMIAPTGMTLEEFREDWEMAQKDSYDLATVPQEHIQDFLQRRVPHYVVEFTLELDDGTQVNIAGGRTNTVYFKTDQFED